MNVPQPNVGKSPEGRRLRNVTMSREVCRDQAIGMGCRLMRSHAPTTTSNPLSCSSTLARSQGVSEDLRGGGGGGGRTCVGV